MKDQPVSIKQYQIKLTEDLGLEKLVSEEVAIKALDDDSYYQNLLLSKNNKLWIQYLFEQALKGHDELNSKKIRGNTKILKNFGKSVVGWSKNGFKKTPDYIQIKRWNACIECSHLTDPPEKFLYHLGRRIISNNKNSQKICGLCGCFAYKKTEVMTERCPGEHPTAQGMSRWMEPLAKKKE